MTGGRPGTDTRSFTRFLKILLNVVSVSGVINICSNAHEGRVSLRKQDPHKRVYWVGYCGVRRRGVTNVKGSSIFSGSVAMNP